MNSHSSRLRSAWKEGSAVALPLLRVVHSSADVCPPLKSAVGLSLAIGDTVAKEWANFGRYVQEALGCVIQALPDASEPGEDLRQNLGKLALILDKIYQDILTLTEKSTLAQFWDYFKDPDSINEMRKEFNDALCIFQLKSAITTGFDVAKLLKMVDIDVVLERLKDKLNDGLLRTLEMGSGKQPQHDENGAVARPGNLLFRETASDTDMSSSNAKIANHFPCSHQLYNSSSLLRLRPADLDASDRGECLSGTRTELLDFVMKWASSTSIKHPILWLNGVAGSGKSTISTTIANHLREQRRLGAFVFFNRDITERSIARNVIRSIAYQLGEFDTRIGSTISAAIDNTSGIAESPIRLQFTKLLVEPLASLPILATEPPILVVLDALDECDSVQGRRELLRLLGEETTRLPPFLRFLITSRAEYDIFNALGSHGHILVRVLELSSHSNNEDIILFIRDQMAAIRAHHIFLSLASDWPGQDVIETLAKCASGLFVWASTACRFINDGHDPEVNLSIVLQSDAASGPELALDALYSTAIQSTGNWNDPVFVSDFQAIMGTILTARNPVTHMTIDKLTGLCMRRPSIHTISLLGCVLSWGDTEPIRVLHPSFADFLSNDTRCRNKSWCIDLALHNQRMAIHCLSYLDGGLTLNICDLTLSLAPITTVLSDEISYASAYWIEHVCSVTDQVWPVIEILEPFLFRHFLHWVEAMSVMRKSRNTTTLVQCLLDWIMKYEVQSKLREFISDGARFVQQFACLIEEHPLLVYLSALPLSPINTVLCQEMVHQDLPWIAGGYEQSWSPLRQVLIGSTSVMQALAYSSDGTQIVSGSNGGAIRTWDVASGVETLVIPSAHSRRVSSVAYYPDGQWIVSGLCNGLIRIWNAASGKERMDPIQGHRGTVSGVKVSPDGTQIVSRSVDNTVRVWGATSGIEVLPPLPIHAYCSWVEFCPRGNRILALSDPHTLCIWDSSSGKEIRVIRDQEEMHSLAISPDGAHVAYWTTGGVWPCEPATRAIVRVRNTMTGAEVCTSSLGSERFINVIGFCQTGQHLITLSLEQVFCILDAHTGAQISVFRGYHFGHMAWDVALSPSRTQYAAIIMADETIQVCDIPPDMAALASPLEPMSPVKSINFSPDRMRIVYGCGNAIHIRSAFSAEILVSLRGHDGEVQSVTFSPDGMLVASGSRDKTIRIWNAASGVEILPPLEGHDSSVGQVRFFLNGERIVSGSNDGTVRVWDVRSGTQLFSLSPEKNCEITVHRNVQDTPISSDGSRVVNGYRIPTVLSYLYEGDADYVLFIAVSPDDQYIVSESLSGHYVWDAVSGACLLKTSQEVYSQMPLDNPIILTQDLWIVDTTNAMILSKLPPTVSISRWASSLDCVAFTTIKHQFHIMHFPPNTLTSLGTWDKPLLTEK